MTKEQAIQNLETIKRMYTWSTGADDALDMAIKAIRGLPHDECMTCVFKYGVETEKTDSCSQWTDSENTAKETDK